MAVLGVRQQHAGQEGAERGRQPHRLHRQRHRDHQQQRGGGEHFRHLGVGERAQQRSQQGAAAGDHRGDYRQRLGDLLPADAGAVGRGEQGHQGQQRDDGDVLEQQDGEGGAAVMGTQLLPLAEHLQHQGGGGHRQCEAHHRRTGGAESHRVRRQGHRAAGEQHLGAAVAKHLAAQRPEPAWLEFEADHEQQQHHAELADVEEMLAVLRKAEAVRADHQSGGEIAEHRAQLRALEQGHEQHGGGEEQRGFLEHGGGRWSRRCDARIVRGACVGRPRACVCLRCVPFSPYSPCSVAPPACRY